MLPSECFWRAGTGESQGKWVEFCPCKQSQEMGKMSPTGLKNDSNDVISHPIKLSQIKGQTQISQEAVGAKGKEGD